MLFRESCLLTALIPRPMREGPFIMQTHASLFLKQLFKPGSGLAMALLLICSAAQAGPPRSLTKTVTGISYKLTLPDPLPKGQQKLILKLMRGSQILRGVQLTAQIGMGDGMKTPVKVSSLPTGEIQLLAAFQMAGPWQLRIQQNAPTKAMIVFDLNVSGP